MRKFVFLSLILAVFIVVHLASAAPDITVKKVNMGSTVAAGLGNPAKFDLYITNNGPTDKFMIFSLVGVQITPSGRFVINSSQTKEVEITATPNSEVLKHMGLVNFEYQINGQKTGNFKDTLTIKVVPLQDILNITTSEVSPQDDTAKITVDNLGNANLDNLKIDFNSRFFSDSESLSLGPHEGKSFIVHLDKNNLQGLVAGDYNVSSVVSYNGLKDNVESSVQYVEKKEIASSEANSGFIIRHTQVTKKNTGNVPEEVSVALESNIITRLFTSASPNPDKVERDGWGVMYYWAKEISPGDSFTASIETNYTFPLIIAILIVLIILFVRIYTLTSVSVNKKVSFVKTKGGQFALKVTLSVRSRKHIDDVKIIDLLPRGIKIYEKFGRKPDSVDEKTRRVSWDIGTMNAGEERVVSYIIYSKLNPVGRFELPPATVVYNLKGKLSEVWSNRAFFMSDTSGRDSN